MSQRSESKFESGDESDSDNAVAASKVKALKEILIKTRKRARTDPEEEQIVEANREEAINIAEKLVNRKIARIGEKLEGSKGGKSKKRFRKNKSKKTKKRKSKKRK
jgi:hypothetical protein